VQRPLREGGIAMDPGTLAVEIEGRSAMPMAHLDDGWFETEVQCGAGARYRYRLDDTLAVPDPASRSQTEDVHDSSVVVDPLAYHWKHPRWRGRHLLSLAGF